MGLTVFLAEGKAERGGFPVSYWFFKLEERHMRFTRGGAGKGPAFSTHFIFAIDGVAHVIILLTEIRFGLAKFEGNGRVSAFAGFHAQFSENQIGVGRAAWTIIRK